MAFSTSGPSPAPSTELPIIKSYAAHATVLSSGSEVFKSRLCSAADGEGSQVYVGTRKRKCPRGVNDTIVVDIQLDNAQQLPAMEILLRHCYSGDLGEELHTCAELLGVLVLADKYLVPTCMTSCCSALAALDAAQFDTASINTILEGIPGFDQCRGSGDLRTKLTARLVQTFGDVDAVCGDQQGLGAQLLQLCLTAALQLFGSDRLQARSENSVVAMADLWVQGPQGRLCTADELRQIAACLRLSQVSFAFMHCVVPHIKWLNLSPEERATLLCYHAANEDLRQHLIEIKEMPGPSAWYHDAASPARKAGGSGSRAASIDWSVTTAELQALLKRASSGMVQHESTSRMFCNGCTCGLLLVIDDDGEIWLGLRLSPPVPELRMHSFRIDATAAYTTAVGLQPADSFAEYGDSHSSCLASTFVWAQPFERALLTLDSWQQYMCEGELRVHVKIASCT